MIQQLGKADASTVLKANHYGRLGCSINNEPYVVPINYFYDGENIYIHSLPGLKIRAMRENPQVCLQVDEVKDDYNWQSVIAFGQYEEITESEEREQVLATLLEKLPYLTPVESRITKGMEEAIVFRVRIERLSGVSEQWQ